MANISAKDVKNLRDVTGIGMMDCKNALEAASGDFDKALKILKEKGMAVAAKRAERETSEGIILIENRINEAFMIKIGCETDFVAKNEDFRASAQEIFSDYIKKPDSYIDSEEQTSRILAVTAKTGEKISLVELAHYIPSSGYIQHYLHSNAKVGVLVEFTCNEKTKADESFIETAKDTAMQIAAMNPLAVRPEEISEEIKKEQKEIFMKQMADSGKPADILEKIVMGKLNKQLSEMCLMEMVFVKDNKLKIKDIISSVSKKTGDKIEIQRFTRMQIGK